MRFGWLVVGGTVLAAFAIGCEATVEQGGSGGGGGQAPTTSTGGSGGGVDPSACAGKTCGAECNPCPPGAEACPAIAGYCSEDGVCGAGAFPACNEPPECQKAEDCTQALAPCEPCADGTHACPSVSCQSGQCVGSFPSCPSECESDEDCSQPSAPCQECGDGTVSCPSVSCQGGQCVGDFGGCSGYEPCGGKSCGDTCTICDPKDPNCNETAVVKYCNAAGACDVSYPGCGSYGLCVTSADCPGIELCKECPDGTCAEMICKTAQCVLECK